MRIFIEKKPKIKDYPKEDFDVVFQQKYSELTHVDDTLNNTPIA